MSKDKNRMGDLLRGPGPKAEKVVKDEVVVGMDVTAKSSDEVPVGTTADANLVDIARAFLKDDDKMTLYADQLRVMSQVSRDCPRHLITIPDSEFNVMVAWHNPKSIGVMPC